MKKSFHLLIVTTLLSIAGCQQLPDQDHIKGADYGNYPTNYELTIKAYYQTTYANPDDIKYNAIHKPVRYYLANQLGDTYYGYLVCATVATKEWLNLGSEFRYDAFLLHNDSVLKYVKGGDWWGETLCPLSE